MKYVYWLGIPLVRLVYLLWCATLRRTEEGRDVLDRLHDQGQPVVLGLWHGEFFPLMSVRRHLPILVVVSRSRDGEFIARVLESLGIRTSRGSSSRGGVAALLRASREMRETVRHACITLDGPRGPRHKAKGGFILLARATPAPVMPVRIYMQRAKIFKSWDRFQLPLPFSRVHIRFGTPYFLEDSEEMTEEARARECRRLEEQLEAMDVPPGFLRVKA